MTDRHPKAAGMPWVSPYLIVRDVPAALEFYHKAFGFEPQGEPMKDETGKAIHAEVKHHDIVIMMGAQCSDELTLEAPVTSGTTCPIALYVYVDDVDTFFVKAQAAGAVAESPPEESFWGDRMCRLRDPEGYRWTFATNVRDYEPETGVTSS